MQIKIAVIGAAGRTGRHVVAQALARGHEVVAVARSPEKLNLAHGALTVVKADARDAQALAGAVEGADAIVSALGAAAGREATDVYSTGVANELTAMAGSQIRRLAVISAAPAGPREDQPAATRLLVMPILDRLFGGAYADMRRMEARLSGSELEWCCLRPPRLLERPATGAYRIGPSPLPGTRSLTYPDLAAALLDCVDGDHRPRGMLYVAGERARA